MTTADWWLSGGGIGIRELSVKGQEIIFWSDVLGLNFGGGYPTVCQNSSICTLKNG